MSKRVIIICLFLSLIGLAFGWGLAGLWITGIWATPVGWWPTLLYAGGFLSLPAGIGMMLGYRVARILAVLSFVAGYLACASLLASPLLQSGFMGTSVNGNPATYGVYAANSLLLLGGLLLLHWTLYTPSFEDHLA